MVINIRYYAQDIIEFDKYAVNSYNAIFNTNIEATDILSINELAYCDVLFYSPPCTDISIAGKQAGIKKGTRSGLILEVERLLGKMEIKPKFLLMENVKNIISKNHKDIFDGFLNNLKSLGYNNYYQILNSKDFNIPQNRERVFCLSIRKDIDNGFEFPHPLKLKLKLKDLLQDNVDDKFYLKENVLNKIDNVGWNELKNKECKKYTRSTSVDYSSPRRLFNIYGDKFGTGYAGNVWDDNHISPTLQTAQGGNRQPLIIDYVKFPAIRKLIPKEYFLLQGFSDADFDKVENINSSTQLYKQAGNSITINVLVAIYKKIKSFYPNDFKDGIEITTLFSGIGAFEKALENL